MAEAGLVAVVADPAAPPAAAPDAAECPLCATHKAPMATVAPDRRNVIMPWAIAVAVATAVAVVGIDAARWFGIGAAAGVLAGAASAWLSVRAALARRAAAHRRELDALAAEGDARVETVIRQFKWAVNDVVKLRRDIERAEDAADALVTRATQRDRYVERLERQLFDARERLTELAAKEIDGEMSPEETLPVPDIVPFRWALHNDGYRLNLELECAVSAHRPTRVRIVDANGEVVMVSGTPMRTLDGAAGFTLSNPPAALVIDLDAGRDCAFHLEALVDHGWKHVSLEDTGRRTKVVYDKQGRLYRVSDDADAAQLLAPTLD